jgi:hypothetical protein
VKLISRQIRVKGHGGGSKVNGILPTAGRYHKIYLSAKFPISMMNPSKTVPGGKENPTPPFFIIPCNDTSSVPVA